ncbi:cupin domain-containing protein [Pedobacter jeongneungensis]|uniref:cupin domain-containing protein n=1 Tax=Pedobacter jeongneungensis TaxID=947309 RepID=UPI000469F411|nr:cupin domain-containing protein [Pedobacter jeongneungensis]
MNTFNTIPRRVVTGEKEGRSVISSDAEAKNVSEHFPGLIISDIWATDSSPAALDKELDIENTAFPITPTRGTYFRYVSIPPDDQLGIVAQPGTPHPLMHQTDTLDYIIIASGEIYLVLDDEETKLKVGDIVIQRGTNHAWSNRSDQPCIQIAVLIDAKSVPNQ